MDNTIGRTKTKVPQQGQDDRDRDGVQCDGRQRSIEPWFKTAQRHHVRNSRVAGDVYHGRLAVEKFQFLLSKIMPVQLRKTVD
jgi:hypothetical protein